MAAPTKAGEERKQTLPSSKIEILDLAAEMNEKPLDEQIIASNVRHALGHAHQRWWSNCRWPAQAEDCSNKSRRRAKANTAIFQEIFALAAEMGVTPLDEQMDIEELITRNAMMCYIKKLFMLRTVLLKHHTNMTSTKKTLRNCCKWNEESKERKKELILTRHSFPGDCRSETDRCCCAFGAWLGASFFVNRSLLLLSLSDVAPCCHLWRVLPRHSPSLKLKPSCFLSDSGCCCCCCTVGLKSFFVNRSLRTVAMLCYGSLSLYVVYNQSILVMYECEDFTTDQIFQLKKEIPNHNIRQPP